eukprot:3363714-Alexandrium_andersonii.AAC.1
MDAQPLEDEDETSSIEDSEDRGEWMDAGANLAHVFQLLDQTSSVSSDWAEFMLLHTGLRAW